MKYFLKIIINITIVNFIKTHINSLRNMKRKNFRKLVKIKLNAKVTRK